MAKSIEKSHIKIKQDEIEATKKERRLRELFFTKERIKKMEAKELEETKEKIWGEEPKQEKTEVKNKPEEDLDATREELTKELAKGEKVEEKTCLRQGYGEAKDEIKEKTDINDLRESIKKVAEAVRAEGVPVDDSCRIDMRAFEGLECEMQGIYSRERIEKDQKFVEKVLKSSNRLKPEDRLKEKGEQLEMLKTCIFHKFLKDDFITVRSSAYDDINNGLDNIVLEKKTGKILCAIDEVVDGFGDAVKRKQQKMTEENLRNGGTFVKYGLGMKDEKVILAPRMNVPVLYLALSMDQVEKGVEDINISNEKSDTEETYYKEFISSMLYQTSLMSSESKKSDINKNLMENVNYFSEILEKMKNQKS